MAKSDAKTRKAKTRSKQAMSDEHKSALAQGRHEGRVVRDYLDALRAAKPRRGRRRTAESIAKRLATIEEQLAVAAPVEELRLLQERRDLTAELETVDDDVDLASIEAAFVDLAASYSRRHGIAYATWREVGVSAQVLKQANIARST